MRSIAFFSRHCSVSPTINGGWRDPGNSSQGFLRYIELHQQGINVLGDSHTALLFYKPNFTPR
jgi:hypothetical protein